MSTKKHRSMGSEEWVSRLRAFASSGTWPSSAGNRPSPKQAKWHNLYQKIEKCPMMLRGQTLMLGIAQTCTCGFHSQQSVRSPAATFASTSAAPARSPGRPALTLAMFEKARFGGTLSAAAKPNVNLTRRPVERPSSPATVPSGRSTPSATPPRVTPPSSPRFYRPVSPFSLPPSSPIMSAARTSSSPLVESDTSPAPPGLLPAPPGLLPAPPGLLPAPPGPLPAPPGPLPAPPGPLPAPPLAAQFWLPVEMRKTIPQQDQRWIASTLWRNQRLRPDVQLWYEPPVPALIYNQVPSPDRFFMHRLLVWMPYHLWKVRLSCPQCKGQLTGAGIHKRARKVLDVDRYYLMVTETLRCNSSSCISNYLSTSQTVLDQLSLALRGEFRLILTRKYACDIRVIRMLRERTLGNSSTRLAKQLRENHGEEWLQRLARYMELANDFARRPGLFPVVCQSPPEPIAVPTNRWLLTVYGKDLMSRMGHIKASITSTFGSILKMDSTKKMTKKLAGAAKGTALWVSSVSNEKGQVLISVLTAQEGPGLDRMVSGLIRRYSEAGVAPPILLYVDCGCCKETGGESKLQARFGGWPDLVIRLDIWHFLRRLAAGCTTDAHALYPIFMATLSVCLFEWDPEDVALLRHAKREELRREGVPGISEALVDSRLTKAQLALYCRRRTRGEEATIRQVEALLQELMGDKGRDLLGVPLLDRVRMEHIWRVQKRHVKCIQDLPGVPLYTKTGTTTTKDGVVLTKYRCARGSTSLESFHCHLNRFIPGTQANDLNFQLYLLDGLNRWNQDRAAAAVAEKMSALLSYSGDLVHCVNTFGTNVFGQMFVPSFRLPSKYTGELIGIDYLYMQTGKCMQDMDPEGEETEQLLEDLGDEAEDEGFTDDTEASLELFSALISLPPAQPSTSGSWSAAPPPPSPPPAQPSTSGSWSAAPPPPSPPPPAQPSTSGSWSAAPPPPSPPPPAQPSTSGSWSAAPPPPSPPPPPPASSAVTAPGAAPQVPVEQLAVDENNIPGLERVDRLAEYLVGLRSQTSLALSNRDVGIIVGLWEDLLPYDQQKAVYHARHQDRLLTGRFRSPKKKGEFTSGVDSLRRCTITASASPAQWPSCCRLVDAICVRLCTLHPSPTKKGKGYLSRWSLILRDYRRIRQLILANGAVMSTTSLQLVEVNQTTLIQWHNRRVARQGVSVLCQGVDLPAPVPVATVVLPPGMDRPAVAPQTPGLVKYSYHLPESTAGRAKMNRRATATATAAVAPAPAPAPATAPATAVRPRMKTAQRRLFPCPPTPAPVISSTPAPFVFALPRAPAPFVFALPRAPTLSGTPALTQSLPSTSFLPVNPLLRYPHAQPPIMFAVPSAVPPAERKRPYNRTGEANKCRRCGEPRSAATGHSQYKGKIYCPSSESLTKEQWLAERRK